MWKRSWAQVVAVSLMAIEPALAEYNLTEYDLEGCGSGDPDTRVRVCTDMIEGAPDKSGMAKAYYYRARRTSTNMRTITASRILIRQSNSTHNSL